MSYCILNELKLTGEICSIDHAGITPAILLDVFCLWFGCCLLIGSPHPLYDKLLSLQSTQCSLRASSKSEIGVFTEILLYRGVIEVHRSDRPPTTLQFRNSPSRHMWMVIIYSTIFYLTTVNFVSPAWIVRIPVSWVQTMVQTAH